MASGYDPRPEPEDVPTASSPILLRNLGEPLTIELSDGEDTRTITVNLPPVEPFPRIEHIEAIAPAELLPRANGFIDPDGVPVIYPEVTYRVVMDKPWLAVDEQSETEQVVHRDFPQREQARVRLESTSFEGSLSAIHSRSFFLETYHYYDWSCDSTDASGCITFDGFEQGIVTGYHLIQNITEQDNLSWALLGEEDHLCRVDGSCDKGLVCSADSVCLPE